MQQEQEADLSLRGDRPYWRRPAVGWGAAGVLLMAIAWGVLRDDPEVRWIRKLPPLHGASIRPENVDDIPATGPWPLGLSERDRRIGAHADSAVIMIVEGPDVSGSRGPQRDFHKCDVLKWKKLDDPALVQRYARSVLLAVGPIVTFFPPEDSAGFAARFWHGEEAMDVMISADLERMHVWTDAEHRWCNLDKAKTVGLRKLIESTEWKTRWGWETQAADMQQQLRTPRIRATDDSELHEFLLPRPADRARPEASSRPADSEGG